MSDTPAILSKSAFAKANGWGKSYVSNLGKANRLVLTADGQVMVAESLALIASTTGATERASPPALAPQNRADRDRKDFYDAENARLDLEERTRKLMKAEDVVAAIANIATTLRTRLEARATILAPQLAALDGNEPRIRTVLADSDRQTLAELSRQFAKLSEQARHPSA